MHHYMLVALVCELDSLFNNELLNLLKLCNVRINPVLQCRIRLFEPLLKQKHEVATLLYTFLP